MAAADQSRGGLEQARANSTRLSVALVQSGACTGPPAQSWIETKLGPLRNSIVGIRSAPAKFWASDFPTTVPTPTVDLLQDLLTTGPPEWPGGGRAATAAMEKQKRNASLSHRSDVTSCRSGWFQLVPWHCSSNSGLVWVRANYQLGGLPPSCYLADLGMVPTYFEPCLLYSGRVAPKRGE